MPPACRAIRSIIRACSAGSKLVGYGLNTRKVVGDSAPLPESAVVEEHAVQRIWEGRVLRAGNHRRPADDTNVAGPLAHGRVAGAGALIDRPRRCGRGDRGQSDRRRGCGRGEWRDVAQLIDASSMTRRHVRSGVASCSELKSWTGHDISVAPSKPHHTSSRLLEFTGRSPRNASGAQSCGVFATPCRPTSGPGFGRVPEVATAAVFADFC